MVAATRARAGWAALFLAPSMAIITLFVIVPIGITILVSLHRWSMLTPIEEMHWVGLDNYATVLSTRSLLSTLSNTIVYSVVTLALTLPLALVLGIFLFKPITRGSTLVRAMIFTTYMVPTVAVALIWSLLYSPLYGPFNQMLGLVGIPAQDFLGSPSQAMASIIALNLWQTLGYYTVIVIAGLTQIPEELHEAAAIDGAGRVRRAQHVTVPLLRRTLLFIAVIVVINTIQVFDPVYVLTQGGPAGSTNVVAYEIFRQAFNFGRAGVASAMAIVLMGIIAFVVGCILLLLRRGTR